MTAPGRAIPYLAVIGAASLWSTLGIGYELILRRGSVDPITLVTLRLATAALLVLAYAVIRDPSALRVPRAALTTLIAYGVVSFAAFYIALVYAYRWAGVPVATVLLYTAPVWVVAGETLFLGYRLSRPALIAIGCALVGCVLVAGIIQDVGSVTPRGIGIGLLAAICYGSYSLLGKRALQTVRPLSVVTYGVVIGAFCLVLVKLLVAGPSLPDPGTIGLIALWPGIGTTVIPVVLYTAALRTLRPSTASILATLEPVMAIALAAVFLSQRLDPWQLVGAVFVIAGAGYLALHPGAHDQGAKQIPAGRVTGG